MDVWVQGWGLAALWVTAIAAVLVLLLVWAIYIKIDRFVRPPVTTKSPAQPGEGSSGA